MKLLQRIQSLFANPQDTPRRSKRSQPPRGRRLGAGFDLLEQRQMLSVTASLSSGTLSIIGDDNRNGASVAVDTKGTIGNMDDDVVVLRRDCNGQTGTTDCVATVQLSYESRFPLMKLTCGGPFCIWSKNVKYIFFKGEAGEDHFINYTSIPISAARGGDHDDVMFGGSGDDGLYGENGVDYIDGGTGDDVIYGGNQGDELYGGQGNDIVVGGLGDDQIYGGSGRNILIGSEGGDHIVGGLDEDIVIGARPTYESVVPVLRAMRDVWAGSGSASTRRYQLNSVGVTVSGSTYRLGPDWIVQDSVAANDGLFGSSGADWFVAPTASEVKDGTSVDFLV